MSAGALLCRKIREAREQLGLTQAEAAKLCGASPRSWIHWEKGERQPDVDIIERLGIEAGRSLNWFFLEETQQVNIPAEEPVSEHTFVKLLARQQDILESQRQDTAKLLAVMAEQQTTVARLTELLARQQEQHLSERQFQQKQAIRQADKHQEMIDELREEVIKLKAQIAHRPTRARQTMLEPPAGPGEARAGGM